MKKIPSHFAGKYVALLNEEVIASGKTTLEVYKKAKQLYPEKMASLIYVPTQREKTDYFISAFELS